MSQFALVRKRCICYANTGQKLLAHEYFKPLTDEPIHNNSLAETFKLCDVPTRVLMFGIQPPIISDFIYKKDWIMCGSEL